MEQGELELRKAFEETSRRNIIAIRDYSTETRDIIRQLQGEIKSIDSLCRQQQNEIQQMKTQISLLLADKYRGGT